MRGGEQYNVVVIFHSRDKEDWSLREGSREEVKSYFEGICPRARQLIDLPKDWKRLGYRRPRTDRAMDLRPRSASRRRRASHAVALGAGRLHCDGRRGDAWRGAARAWQRLPGGLRALPAFPRRPHRTYCPVGREMGRIVHAKGVERLVRNELWKDRLPERFYNAMEWLYGWTADNCLAD